ncbi:Glycerophosphodiester phosphodiesterase, cytoplasmic [Thauera sp. GDN1]|uniref:glycerophosphodiester phosphodiesterase n=1 Tax=Thauera sp. GDN1 TaxID=2944810 RepID=UPI00247A00EC|nr:glycerophosphodiester phosphodiesterase [Thauera sp. GDN1]WEN41818.1 Glycerophosphodiester phosphodiesterase, cytoplasmic [Thauera sp. GDN1]
MATAWPYPRWIAHRGAGRLAPENTLAAFALGHAHGYRMFECDVRLSADGRAFLLHDDSLERTTDGVGEALARNWAELARLDAGAWHSPRYAGERLPTLDAILAFCMHHRCALNVELKPAPGDAQRTGEVVAVEIARRWVGTPPPLLSSFAPEALAAAAEAAPQLPRGLLLERFADGWLESAQRLDCIAIVAEQRAWSAETAAAASAAGLHRLAYTVNDDAEAARLLGLGLDGLITDRVDHFRP